MFEFARFSKSVADLAVFPRRWNDGPRDTFRRIDPWGAMGCFGRGRIGHDIAHQAKLDAAYAVGGEVPGTEHYRDADRFNVETIATVKTLRIDDSLYYANARYLEDRAAKIVAEYPEMTDLVLMCTGVSYIDASALSSLREINRRLKGLDVRLHLSAMQSIVRERLYHSDFLEKLNGNVYLSQHDAVIDLQPEPDWSQFSDHIDIH